MTKQMLATDSQDIYDSFISKIPINAKSIKVKTAPSVYDYISVSVHIHVTHFRLLKAARKAAQ